LKTPDGFAALPMLSMDVELRVTGIMARGIVTQTFDNPTSEVIEALYVFPLPEKAAVDRMEMQVGDRRIHAVVREREEARAAYETARSSGRKAGLLEQRPSHLFTTAVANINPGETVSVRLEYVEEILWQEGRYSLSFPLTYTPRFTPHAPAEDRTAATTFGAPAPVTGAARPEPAAVGSDAADDDGAGCFVAATHAGAPRARIRVRIEAGLPLGPVTSPSHPIRVAREATTAWIEAGPAGADAESEGHVTGDEAAGRPVVPSDRDFVLSWQVPGGPGTRGAVFVEERGDGRYALVMLVPPAVDAGPSLPARTLFIVDVSGSMDGPSIEQARKALLSALDRLHPGDSFNLIRFNDSSSVFRQEFQAAVPSNLAEARGWVRGLVASGGTEILEALRRGMQLVSADRSRQVKRIVLITDGAVNGEEAVIQEVSRSLGEARLHVIGIGSAPNRRLMRRVARFGRGTCDFIVSQEEVEERIDGFLRRIDRPVLADLRLDWDGAPPLDSYPVRLPDLYAGEPLYVSLRLGPAHPGTRVRLTGWAPGGEVGAALSVAPDTPQGAGVATRWARARVDELLDGLLEGVDPDRVRESVVEVATRFNMVTRYTSLVAVEDAPTATGEATPHALANALPPGGQPDGSLPMGGTSGPLYVTLGFLLALLGLSLVGLGRFFAA
jgi:Ca-activated chloride channel family protein